MMKRTNETERAKDLVRLLGGLGELHGQLVKVVRNKIDAMKRADRPAMRELAQQEHALTTKIQEREGLRRQITDLVGEQVGLSPGEGRSLTMSQLASRLSHSLRCELLDAGGELRETVSKLARANRVAGVVSRDILNHLKWVFASVRSEDEQPAGYSGDGALVSHAGTRIFETVG